MEIKISLENIQTLTDFKRNAKDYVERIKATKSPLVLTVNGKAEVVVHEVQAFQDIMDRLQHVESELRKLKLEMLRREINIGIEQLFLKTSKNEDAKSWNRTILYEQGLGCWGDRVVFICLVCGIEIAMTTPGI